MLDAAGDVDDPHAAHRAARLEAMPESAFAQPHGTVRFQIGAGATANSAW
jgi:hypothetical protein